MSKYKYINNYVRNNAICIKVTVHQQHHLILLITTMEGKEENIIYISQMKQQKLLMEFSELGHCSFDSRVKCNLCFNILAQ